jgi:hypothetical protein
VPLLSYLTFSSDLIVEQLPTDPKIKKIDLFSGFPPLSLYQSLCHHQQQEGTEEARHLTLEAVLRATPLKDLKLGGERVTVRYLE